LLLFIFFHAFACAKKSDIPKHRYGKWGETPFELTSTYTVRVREYGKIREPGTHLSWSEENVRVTVSEEGKTYLFKPEHIYRIDGVGTERVGNRALAGLGYGALIGAGVLGTTAIIGNSVSDCRNAIETDDCEAMRAAFYLLSFPLGALIGGAIGLGVGAATPAKAKITILPTQMSTREAAPGVSVSGRF